VTRLGRSTLLLNSKAPEQMTAECWRWRPRWNRLASSASCFGSSACLQSSSSVLCETAYGLESPQDRLGGTHAEGAGHPDKLKLYNTCILPIFLYGSDCWAISKMDTCKIDALDQWCLRVLLGIKWYQFVRNDDVRRLTKQPKLTAIIQSCRLIMFGHIMRMDDNADAKRILLASSPAD